VQYEGVYNFPEQTFDKVLDDTEVTDEELEDEVGRVHRDLDDRDG
jgi:hypothetical protein